MLSFVLGTVVLVLIVDALFLEGRIRTWAWDRIKKSGKKNS